jgi:hypothetical protein
VLWSYFDPSGITRKITILKGEEYSEVITPTSGTVNSSNPSYSAVALVNSYTPFASSVGDIATFSITLPTSGTVTRGTV